MYLSEAHTFICVVHIATLQRITLRQLQVEGTVWMARRFEISVRRGHPVKTLSHLQHLILPTEYTNLFATRIDKNEIATWSREEVQKYSLRRRNLSLYLNFSIKLFQIA